MATLTMATTYQRQAIYTAEDVRAVADGAGSPFFSPETMRFFSSRVLGDAWQIDGYETKPGRRYVFVTSEKYGEDAPRHYAVRLATLGTVREAKRVARSLADELRYGN